MPAKNHQKIFFASALPNVILYQTEAQRVENFLERTPSPPAHLEVWIRRRQQYTTYLRDMQM